MNREKNMTERKSVTDRNGNVLYVLGLAERHDDETVSEAADWRDCTLDELAEGWDTISPKNPNTALDIKRFMRFRKYPERNADGSDVYSEDMQPERTELEKAFAEGIGKFFTEDMGYHREDVPLSVSINFNVRERNDDPWESRIEAVSATVYGMRKRKKKQDTGNRKHNTEK